ncbi:MAG: TRAP transporter small permease subunit [Burkholderiales bacterium]|nr:TRAP transporter small permease subunit [Burkholderiales bacterium]
MQLLLHASRWIDTLNERIAKWVAWLGLVAVLICTGNALARYTLNAASNAWLELQWYFNSAVFLLVAGYALRRNEHVRIDVINNRLSPRARAWIDIFGSVFFLLPTAIIIGVYGGPTLINSVSIQEYSSDPGGLIRWPVRLLIPIAFGLLALQGLSEIVKRVAFLKGLIPWSELDPKSAHGAVPHDVENAGKLEAEAR